MQQDIQAVEKNEGGEKHVLRVVIENMQYEVTLEVFYTIFSKFGQVLKIITFQKNSMFTLTPFLRGSELLYRIWSSGELHIILKRRNFDLCEYSSFFKY